jgi:hypothetical protein
MESYRRLLPPALVGLAALAVYAHTVSFQFVYDDIYVIVKNPRLHSLGNWAEILASPWWPRGLYRPFTSLTFAANWSLSPGEPYGFHLVNVLCHAVAAILVWALAHRLLPAALAGAGALASGLVFAVHPVHVEAVANVVGRAEILATVFVLAATLLYLRHGDPDTPSRLPIYGAGTLFAAVLALASKETAFALPGVLLIADWIRARVTGEALRARIARSWPLWAGTLAISIGWLGLRTSIVGDLVGDTPAPGIDGAGMVERIVIMAPVVAQYLRLLLFPAHLSADYSPDYLPLATTVDARVLLGLLLLAICIAVAVRLRDRAPVVSAGIAWTGVSILIVSNVLVPTGVMLAERTLYLASAGVCFVAGWAFATCTRRRRELAFGALGVVLVAGAARTVSRAMVWRNDVSFFPSLVADAPGSYRSDWVSAMLTYMAGDSTEGERLMRRGLAVYSRNPVMLSDFAVVLERQGRWREAAGYFWGSFLGDSTRGADAARAVANHVQAGQLDSARILLEQAQRALPESRDLAISESHLALAAGDARRSLALRLGIAREQPDDWRYWLLSAEAAVPARDCEVLEEALERLRALRPSLRRTEQLTDSARVGCPASSRTK